MEAGLPFGLVASVVYALGGADPVSHIDGEGASAVARTARFYQLLRWLEDQATTPLLVALDDLHWADADSLAFVSFLCRRIAARPIAVVATLRPWPPASHEIAEALAHDGHASLQVLAPLSGKGVHSLLSARLGRPADDPVSARVAALSAGNPLLVEQLAHAMASGDEMPEPLAAGPSSLSVQLLLARFAGLEPSGLRCAQAASVFGVRFRPALAAEIADLASEETDVALESLFRSGLVRQDVADVAVFEHPLFRQALYDDLAPPVRARLHARAFFSLLRRSMEAEAVEHATFGDLEGDLVAVTLLEEHGKAALQTGALATASRHLEAAVQLAGEACRPELLMALGESLSAVGRIGPAVDVYERVVRRRELSAAARVDALRMLGRSLASNSAHELAGARFEEAVRLAEELDPAMAVQVLLDHALATWLTGGPAVALPLTVRARALARGSDEPTRRRAEAAWGFISVQAGDGAGVEATSVAARAACTDPLSDPADLSSPWGALLTHGLALAFVERFAEAEDVLALAEPAAERIGAAETAAGASIAHAYVLSRRGRPADALGLVERARSLEDVAPMNQMFAGVAYAYILLQLGRADESEQWCRRLEAVATRRKEWIAAMFLNDTRGQRHLREGRVGEACELYLVTEQLSQQLGIGEPCNVPWARHAIAAHLGADRIDDATRVIAWLDRCAETLPCRWIRIAGATGRAGLAERDGDLSRAEEHFRHALALHEEVDLALERVETLIAYGAFLRRSGHPAKARPLLAEALAIAEKKDAAWYVDAAAEELAVAGGRRRRARSSPGELTPQERRIASLAREGRSNREIAQRLVVALSTVETHLQHIYAKLGINSRRQLMTMPAPDSADAKDQGNP